MTDQLAMGEKTEFVIGHSLWDNSDYVVTIRPSYEAVWKSIAFGGVLSKREALLIAEWLQGAMPTLWKIFQNISKEQIGRSMANKVYGQHLAGAKQLLSAAKAIQADALGLGAPSAPDPDRLRLLEAVAKAVRAHERIRLNSASGRGMSFTEYLAAYSGHIVNSRWRAVLEALAALDEKEQP